MQIDSLAGCVPIIFKMDSWAILSKNPVMSASKTQMCLAPRGLSTLIVEALRYSVSRASTNPKPIGVRLKLRFPFGISASF